MTFFIDLAALPEFSAIWGPVQPSTMTSPEHDFALWAAVTPVIDSEIPLCFVTFGVGWGFDVDLAPAAQRHFVPQHDGRIAHRGLPLIRKLR